MKKNNLYTDYRIKKPSQSDYRTNFEIDHDRLLFSTPVRRMADKTQVFPLETNDSVRTRLTHSMEVSNIAKSIGIALVSRGKVFKEVSEPLRVIPPILATTGLMHDLGNPPFGHSGEKAISNWFKKMLIEDNENKVESEKKYVNELTKEEISDLTNFEGNAQTFRLVTRLQLLDHEKGLDLTYGTLASSLKYPCFSKDVDESKPFHKKYSVFCSEKDRFKDVFQEVNIAIGKRHPLVFIMEACDDIAYSVFDIEDGVKKKIVSFKDIISYLELNADLDTRILQVVSYMNSKYIDYSKKYNLNPSELNDVAMQRFRAYCLSVMIEDVVNAFEVKYDDILAFNLNIELVKASASKRLIKLLKDFAFKNLYKHKTVLEIELEGYKAIQEVMTFLWKGIEDRQVKPTGLIKTPFEDYCYSLISENYKRVFESENKNNLSPRYREFQLLIDMVSGMTDSYLMNMSKELNGLKC